MTHIKYRVLLIVGLVLSSIWALVPRQITIREPNPQSGVMRDTVIKRVPIKYGLDLQGGMHLALEVDESKGTIANKSDALERALKVVRNRIDQFGTVDPLVQKAGSDRIIVELPGV